MKTVLGMDTLIAPDFALSTGSRHLWMGTPFDTSVRSPSLTRFEGRDQSLYETGLLAACLETKTTRLLEARSLDVRWTPSEFILEANKSALSSSINLHERIATPEFTLAGSNPSIVFQHPGNAGLPEIFSTCGTDFISSFNRLYASTTVEIRAGVETKSLELIPAADTSNWSQHQNRLNLSSSVLSSDCHGVTSRYLSNSPGWSNVPVAGWNNLLLSPRSNYFEYRPEVFKLQTLSSGMSFLKASEGVAPVAPDSGIASVFSPHQIALAGCDRCLSLGREFESDAIVRLHPVSNPALLIESAKISFGRDLPSGLMSTSLDVAEFLKPTAYAPRFGASEERLFLRPAGSALISFVTLPDFGSQWQITRRGEKLRGKLATCYPALIRLWDGAVDAGVSANPDRTRHCAISLREMLTSFLERFAPIQKVKIRFTAPKWRNPKGEPTKKARFKYLMGTDYRDSELEAALCLVGRLNACTHNALMELSDDDLQDLLAKVEDLIHRLIGFSGN